jgi:protein-tyrosine phosphatase
VIDTHCHLLPGLDDGTRSVDEAIALARELVEAGVHTVLCTPHQSRRFPTDPERARQRLEELRGELDVAGIALTLHLSAELNPAAALSLASDRLRGLAIGGRYLLVELEPTTPASAVDTVLQHLDGEAFVPIFAHPERCRAVMRDVSGLSAAREAGALVQVVATSLAGAWGRSVQGGARSLLAEGRVDLLGSDAHRPGRTGRRLREVLRWLDERFGRETVQQLTSTTPQAVLAGQSVR